MEREVCRGEVKRPGGKKREVQRGDVKRGEGRAEEGETAKAGLV